MNKLIARGALLLALSTCLTGCSSIVNGTTQKIPVSSNPSEAIVFLDDVQVGQTPVVLKAKRKHDHIVVVEKAGYKPATVQLTSNGTMAIAGNLLAGGIIGIGVDAATGASKHLTPEAVTVTLEKEDTSAE